MKAARFFFAFFLVSLTSCSWIGLSEEDTQETSSESKADETGNSEDVENVNIKKVDKISDDEEKEATEDEDNEDSDKPETEEEKIKNNSKSLIKGPDIAESELFDMALKAYDRGLYSLSKQRFQEFLDGYPGSYYGVLAELKLADSFFLLGDFPAAIASYENFVRLHPGHEAITYVKYQIANCYRSQATDTERDTSPLKQALQNYENLIREFENSGSEYVVLGKIAIKELRGEIADHDIFVAKFYFRQEKFAAAEKRMKDILRNYPETNASKEAQVFLEENFSKN